MRLEGKIAVITGVNHARQVGFALAKAFIREGALGVQRVYNYIWPILSK